MYSRKEKKRKTADPRHHHQLNSNNQTDIHLHTNVVYSSKEEKRRQRTKACIFFIF